jgi:phosphatidylglycerol:prolipoprotein diacylglycerol transferase
MPNGFALGPLYVHFYGVVIAVGILLAGLLAALEARRVGQDPEVVWDLIIWLVVGGIVGARLWHVFTPSPTTIAAGKTTVFYLSHPLEILMIWNGGLGIPGAVLGGAIALFFFARKHGLDFLRWADIAVPSLALGQAIGRWGNYFNQELYGAPTDLPWKLYIEPIHRLAGFRDVEYYHPLFLYESLWNLANMALLLWLGRRFGDRLQPGSLLLVYLVIYPLGRFLLDFLRLDASLLLGINANQTFMAVVAFLAALALAWRLRHLEKDI